MLALAAAFAGGAAVHVAIAMGLHLWGRRVAKRRAHRGAWRWAPWIPVGALGVTLLGAASSLVVLVVGTGTAISASEAASKAARLGQGISDAMNVMALFVLVSWGIYLGSLVQLAVGSLPRRSRSSDH